MASRSGIDMRHFKNVHVSKTSLVLTAVPNLVPVQPKKIKVDPTNLDIEAKIIPWGSDNLYPQKFYQKILKNSAAVGALNALKSTLYGSGFELVKLVEDAETGDIKTLKQPLGKFPDIRDFLRRSKYNRFWYELMTDASIWEFGFVECILSVDKNSIAQVKRLQTAQCRFEEPDKKGYVRHIHLNTDWETANAEYHNTYDYIDPDMGIEEVKQYVVDKNLDRFVISNAHPLVTENFYPQAGWHAADRSGWIDQANSVPEMANYILENQLHFKYIIYVSDIYFESFYKEEWDEFDADKRQEMREALAETIDAHMRGKEAAGRSLITPIIEENGKFVEGIKVVPVDNKLKSDALLPNAQAANEHVLFAAGVDPTIIGGNAPGGSNLSGSGSDKREAYTILAANLTPRRHLLLEIWDFVRDYNEWDPDLEGVFPNINLTTLDKNPNGQAQVIN